MVYKEYIELNDTTIFKMIENNLSPKLIKYKGITNIIKDGNKFLIKLEKRFVPLSDEDYEGLYK